MFMSDKCMNGAQWVNQPEETGAHVIPRTSNEPEETMANICMLVCYV